MRVVLCDLTHTGQGYGSEFIPFAIGLLSEYAGCDAVLCKTVDDLWSALSERTDIVGFSHYLWNTNLSNECAKRIRENSPHTRIVFGGPSLTIDIERRNKWLEERPWIDTYVVGEGEIGFRRFLQRPLDRWIEGDHVIDLNDIPSPYLSGKLDRFLANPHLIPSVESTRSCPFRCTFCFNGALKTPVRHYNLERVRDEVEYIAQRTKAKNLYLSDGNFGMYEWDESVAEMFIKSKEKYGYPEYIIVSTGKNAKERIINIGNKMGKALPIAASVQSLDPVVLKNIHRSNVSLDDLTSIPLSLDEQTTCYSEVICGLPGDTQQKHEDSICKLIDMGYDQIRMHQLTLLPGSEMEAQDWGFITKYRLLQRFFGKYTFYGDMRIYETERIVVGSNTMPIEEFFNCRAFGLTVSLMFNEGVAKELAAFLSHLGIKYSDYIKFANDRLVVPQNAWTYSGARLIQDLYYEFVRAASHELYDNLSDVDISMTEVGWKDLLDGKRANNLLRNAQGYIRYSYSDELNKVMFLLARYFIHDAPLDTLLCLNELEDYCKLLKGPLSNLDAVDTATFNYDFTIFERVEPYTLRFYYEPWQKELWTNQFEIFGTTDQGLGKMIARAPLKHTYRRCERI